MVIVVIFDDVVNVVVVVVFVNVVGVQKSVSEVQGQKKKFDLKRR